MKDVNHRKITKKAFEQELYEKHGITQYRPYDEFDQELHLATRLYLYYKNDVHIGTWSKSKREGWEFVEDRQNRSSTK